MKAPPIDPVSTSVIQVTCQITGGSFSHDPTLPLEVQPIPQQLRFGYRPGAERDTAGVWGGKESE